MFGKKKKNKEVNKIYMSSNGVELGMYCLYDKMTEEYNAPFLMKNDKLAVRAFQSWLEAKKPQGVSQDDFDLFFVGTFEPGSGIVNGKPIRFIPWEEK